MHTIPSQGSIPGVEVGVVLAWPCPACRCWAKPAVVAGHVYGCRRCGALVVTAELNACYRAVRSLTLDEFARN